MNEPVYRYIEVAVYALLNFLPFLVLGLMPFREKMRFSPRVTLLLITLLTAMQIFTGIVCTFYAGAYVAVLSALSTLLYAGFYFLAVRDSAGKIVFTLLMLSNVANLVVVCSKCAEGLIFGDIALESYRWTHSLCMAGVHLFTTLPLGIYIHRRYVPALTGRGLGAVWHYLWLVPAIFYFIWYAFLYGQPGSSLEICLKPFNSLYLFVINLGAVFVYHTVLRLITEQEKNMALEKRNHQLATQHIQYENLQEKIEEARHARHDLRHHIILLRAYLQEKNYAELENHLCRLQDCARPVRHSPVQKPRLERPFALFCPPGTACGHRL